MSCFTLEWQRSRTPLNIKASITAGTILPTQEPMFKLRFTNGVRWVAIKNKWSIVQCANLHSSLNLEIWTWNHSAPMFTGKSQRSHLCGMCLPISISVLKWRISGLLLQERTSKLTNIGREIAQKHHSTIEQRFFRLPYEVCPSGLNGGF